MLVSSVAVYKFRGTWILIFDLSLSHSVCLSSIICVLISPCENLHGILSLDFFSF
jgi:hypothetical protein